MILLGVSRVERLPLIVGDASKFGVRHEVVFAIFGRVLTFCSIPSSIIMVLEPEGMADFMSDGLRADIGLEVYFLFFKTHIRSPACVFSQDE